jgi:tetratricopeptide (TPR) repeat protein
MYSTNRAHRIGRNRLPPVGVWAGFVTQIERFFLGVAIILALTPLATRAAGPVVDTDPLNRDPAVRAAYDHFYILDYAGALERFRKIAADHPDDPIAEGYILNAVLFSELYRLDLLDTTLYAHDGFLSGKHPVEENKQVTAQVNDLADKMIERADSMLKTNPRDVNALYARSWARSEKSIYMGLVQHSFISALHLALQSRSDSDKILSIDPNYVDADLVVGVHQYVVGCLPFAVKMMAGVVGEGGSKQKGLSLLREAGQNGVLTNVEARTALMLFLRREAKYPEAAQVARGLKEQYPRDFLFWLEEANLLKDAGNAPEAIAHYRAALEQAKKPGYFPNAHLELAFYGLGDTLRGQHLTAESAAAFDQVALQPTASPDLKRRAELAAGEQYDILHNRQKATAEYQAVLRDGAGSPQASDAEKFLHSPFSAQ